MGDVAALTADEARLVAAARKARTAEIAAAAVAFLEDRARPMFGDGVEGDVVMDMLKSLILSACGCICTPGRRLGGPVTHAEDMLCPVHGTVTP